uniref:Uncharacterized protein n=1 Tax=Anguilla anguilla TaxID=7936 RepID=A0A0E9Y2P6_ANGAN
MWDSSWYSGFLPQSKHNQVMSIGHAVLPISVTVRVCVNVSVHPVMDWCPVQGLFWLLVYLVPL